MFRSKLSRSFSDRPLKTTCTPAVFARRTDRATTFTAEKSNPETWVKSIIRQDARDGPSRDFLRWSAKTPTLPKKVYP